MDVAGPRYLTFNWHETYVHMLAGVGGRWDVVLRKKGGRSDWLSAIRPFPGNASVVSEDEAGARAARGDYQAVVCHNLLDLGLVAYSGVPTVTIFHTSRDLELVFGLDAAAFDRDGRALLARSTPVFVSAAKQASWGIAGPVILPGVDLDHYGGWRGDLLRVLHIGNMKRELAAVNGLAALEAAIAGLPFTLVGLNPTIPGAELSRDWDAARDALRAHRAYLHTSEPPYEDGYNLAMLEAMATGSPVVALAHPTSPIVDGVNGRSGVTASALRVALLELLEDADEARRLGAAGRETVADLFPIARFHEAWRALIG